ncbi:hypothetical protein Tco_0169839, partial [Tanacetum coccineum]
TYQWDAGINKEVHDVREAWLRKNFHGFMGEVLDEAKKTYTQVISRASNGKNYGLLAPFVPNWMRLQEKATGAPVSFQALFEDTPSQKGVYTTLKTKRVAVYFFIVFAFCVLKESFIFKQLSASGTVITQLDLPKKNENLVRCSKCREVCIVMYDAMGKKWKSRSKGSFVLSCMGLWTKNADKEAGQVAGRDMYTKRLSQPRKVKRIFRYLRGTVNMGLWYTKDSGFELTEFSNADYAGCKDTFKSTSDGAQFLSEKLTQLTDYGFYFNKIPIYCDSKSAIAISYNLVQHSRTKHIVVRYHFIKEHMEKGTIELYFVKTDYQLADLFTKALLVDRFYYLVRRLALRRLSPQELDRLVKLQ